MRLTKRSFWKLVHSLFQLLLHILLVIVIIVTLVLSPLADLLVWARSRPKSLEK